MFHAKLDWKILHACGVSGGHLTNGCERTERPTSPEGHRIRIDIKYPGWFSDHIVVLRREDEPDRAVIVRRHNRKQRHIEFLTRAQLVDLLTQTIVNDQRAEAPKESNRDAS